MKKLARQVYDLVAKIPQGKIATYGQIAMALKIKSPRLVGRILHQNQDPQKVPCHRVVFANGSLAKNYTYGGLIKQKERLLKEGIEMIGDKVILTKSNTSNFF